MHYRSFKDMYKHRLLEEYEELLKKQQKMLDIKVGQVFKIRMKSYKVTNVYPHWIRLESKDGNVLTLNKGQIMQYRGTSPITAEAEDNGIKRQGVRRKIRNTKTGEIYKNVAELAKKLKVTSYIVVSRIELQKELKGTMYEYV